jgi:hypothetical protein
MPRISHREALQRVAAVEAAIRQLQGHRTEVIMINDPKEGLEDYVIENISVYETIQIGDPVQPNIEEEPS